MVLKRISNRKVPDDANLEIFEVVTWTDSGKHEQLRRIYSSRTHNDFAFGTNYASFFIASRAHQLNTCAQRTFPALVEQ